MKSIQQQVDELVDGRPGKSSMAFVYDETAYKISNTIFRSSGSTASYLVLTDAGRVIINCGLGHEAPHHRRVFDEVSTAPIRHIVTTQAHNDHIAGVHAFREEGTTYVAHRNNAFEQHEDHRVRGRMGRWAQIWFPYDREVASRLAAERPDLPSRPDRPTPDVTFEDRMTLQVGTTEIQLFGGVGETTDSVIVWLPAERTAFISNLLGPMFPHFPNLNTLRGQKYRFVEPYLSSLTTLRELRPEVLVTGRGEPIRGEALVDAALERLYGAVDYVHQQVLAGLNGDSDAFTLAREIRLPDHLRVGQGYGRVSWAVRTIWESYLGWFHHRSTTELYPLDPSTLLTELVQVAGVDAVLARTAALLDEDRAVEAVGLAEAILAVEPDSPGARSLLRRGLTTLAADPETDANFWHSGWLRHQLALLEERP